MTEMLLVEAVRGAVAGGASHVVKRIAKAVSGTKRREQEVRALTQAIANHNFAQGLRLSVLLPAMPEGLSMASVDRSLKGLLYQGLIHELVAANLADAPNYRIERIQQNFEIATQEEFENHGLDKQALRRFGRVLFDEIDLVIKSMVTELPEDQLRKLQHGAALTLLEATLEAADRRHSMLSSPSRIADRAAIADWETTYLAQARMAHGHIEPPDFERKRKVPVDRLFVAPQISQYGELEQDSKDALWLCDNVDRTVLLGDPGGGKSTTANVIAWKSATNDTRRIPFLVVLRLYAANTKQSIVDYIEGRLASHYQCAPPRGAVESMLLSGKALVIFDGLDELIDTARRREMTDRVELFCNRYPLTSVLVTSRKVGYDQAQLDTAVFDVYTLAGFSQSDVELYVRNWFSEAAHMEGGELDRSVQSFMAESESAPDLRANPLMLSLMCIIYRGEQWIPRNRPDMYEHCAKLLFEKWDSSRHIFVELRAKSHVDSAVKHLAYWMFTERSGVDGVTETELARETVEYLRPAFASQEEAKDAAREFVEFCRGRAWVLSEAGTTADGEGLFKFTHRTFMEYFAAYELTRRADNPTKLAKMIIPHVAKGEWEVVAELAAQIINKHARDGAARLFEALLSDRRRRSAESINNIYSFLGRCLGFIHVPVTLARRIVQGSVNATIEVLLRRREGGALSLAPLSVMELRVVVPELGDVVEESLRRTLREMLTSAEDQQRHIVCSLILAFDTVMEVSIFFRRRMLPSRTERSRWNRLAIEMGRENLDEILREDAPPTYWRSAWKKGLVSMEEALEKGTCGHLPLDALFEEEHYVALGFGTAPWAAQVAFYNIGAYVEEEEKGRITDELNWLGRYVDTLGPPPWVSIGSKHLIRLERDEHHEPKMGPSDAEWAQLILLMASIEIISGEMDSMHALEYRSEEATQYGETTALYRRRYRGEKLPVWLEGEIEKLRWDRKRLLEHWLAGKVDLVASMGDLPSSGQTAR